MAVQLLEPRRQAAPQTVTRMIDVDAARARILAAFAPLPMVRVPLAAALGSVLAVDVIAGESVPAFPNAAMDGFAVRAEETLGASAEQPVRLRVIAEAAAGYEMCQRRDAGNGRPHHDRSSGASRRGCGGAL